MTSFGLYIHWPFCVSKCPYCDFNSHVRKAIDEQLWQEALLTELKHVSQQTQGRRLTSIFFGGGTPSLMPAKTVEKLIAAAATYWTPASDLEITLEANPNSVDLKKFQDFKQAGVNRLSMGIQSLREKDLAFLGRSHGRAEALQALKVAQKIFDSYSFDLIYARPTQTIDEWEDELQEALSYARGHLSLYQLTIEPGTAFYTAYTRGDWQLPSEDVSLALYETTADLLSQKGFEAYEVSNYAQPGFACRHNLTYWRYEDFAAIGPGAHGRLTLENKRYATKCLRAPETWLQAIHQSGHGVETIEELSSHDQLVELILMGLRLKEGIALSRFEEVSGNAFQKTLDQEKVALLQEQNLLNVTDSHLKATFKGTLVLNYLVGKITETILEKSLTF
jgi:putative oxygen-independent coproporphyrinogen III oxidase